ncbi:hypothetical protein C7974DRAFT_390461 [Boeremia exigua]|uniref:uncharacterized protein n=1 Tax=Boeremia exigua TaxID=749465 RepID=UPI001E8E79D3|nr:uncharacterized protein C7974DRAFT_390461 [Boeremia exigua]KAH6637895.1 hypothetical protein C7974DRAFT_390461 [Boeremia exigua]
MAGTRRRSRARDTIKTHQRRRSASHLVSTVPETAIATNANVGEVAEGADEGSPRPEGSSQPETLINRSVSAFCKECSGKIGEFYNSWHKVTSSYFSPALLGSYRSLLRTSAWRKSASDSTELAGCTIDLTCCPGCSNHLGFIVVDTPAGGKRFRGREFFKLQHIELRCEVSPNKTITVKPQENVAPDLVLSEGSKSPSPTRVETTPDTMEFETPLSSSHPLWTKPELQQQRPYSQPRDFVRQSLQSNVSLPQPVTLPPPVVTAHSPVNRSVASSDSPPLLPPSQASPQPAQLPSVHTIGSSIRNPQPEPAVNGHSDGHKYPRDPRDVRFDAIQRLQTQISQNTSVLAAQSRTQVESAEIVRQIESSLRSEFQGQLQRQDQELRRLGDTVNQLARELTECRQTMVGLGHEVHVARTESARRSSDVMQPIQDDALELMARRIGDISHRTTDLETLRDLVSILGGKVQRLESESAPTRQPHPQLTYPAHQPMQPVQVAHAAPLPPPQPPVHVFQTPARPTSNPQVVPVHENSAATMPPESAQRPEPVPAQNGWATVNAGVKRTYESATNSPHQNTSSAPGSPKRPKLVVTGGSQDSLPSQPPIEPPHMLLSQTQPVVASQPLTQPGPFTGPHPGAHPGPPPTQPYPPYGTQEGPSDQSWRPESQRMAESRPARGRGSRGGRGPGSRGGRVRKSMQGHEYSMGTPDWERDHWTAIPDTQASPSVIDGHSRSIVRRGGGAVGPRSGPLSVERSNEWTPEIGPRTVYHSQDSPIEVKKTRSKPIRNEDGILVRKDGRPDRRSQSSAANLRKVHARKEEQQREAEAGSTPTGYSHTTPAGLDTPSPTSRDSHEPDVTDSVRRKHRDILGRIFPEGLNSSRKQHDYAHQVFNEDRDHTAHPRSRVIKSTKAAPRVKKEYVERSEVAETQTPNGGDVEMDDGASTNGHEHDDTETPSGEVVTASDQTPVQEENGRGVVAQKSTVQIPETQATNNSVTVAAQSAETA